MSETDRKTWVVGQSEWAQYINQERFELIRSKGKDLKPDGMVHQVSDLILGARVHKSNCNSFPGTNSHYPPEFVYCPFCGSELIAPSDSEDWVPPYGSGKGIKFFKRAALSLQRTPETAKAFPLPIGGDFQFIVAKMGTLWPVLICFNRMSGKVSVFNPLKNEWLPFKEKDTWVFGKNELPEWSWSAGLIAKNQLPGFAVPSANGPVWLEIDWDAGTVTHKVGSGECVGGVGVLGGKAYVPVVEDRKIFIHCYDPKNGRWELLSDESKIESEQDMKNFFSVPLIDEELKIIFWIGINGLLKCTHPDSIDHTEISYHPWKTDANSLQAVPELGPPFRDNSGNYWQICYDDLEETYCYFNLADSTDNAHEVDGGRFSSGLVSFCKHFEYWAHPWEKRDESRDYKKNKFRVPLLTIDSKSLATVTVCFSQNLGDPIKKILTNKEKKFDTQLIIEFPDRAAEALSMSQPLHCSRPWELRPFVYRDELIVYLPETGACCSWKLW